MIVSFICESEELSSQVSGDLTSRAHAFSRRIGCIERKASAWSVMYPVCFRREQSLQTGANSMAQAHVLSLQARVPAADVRKYMVQPDTQVQFAGTRACNELTRTPPKETADIQCCMRQALAHPAPVPVIIL